MTERTASLELSYRLVELATDASPLAELVLGRGGSKLSAKLEDVGFEGTIG